MLYVTPVAPPAPGNGEPPSPEATPEDPVEVVRTRTERAAAAAGPSDDSLLIYACLKEAMHHRGMDLPILAPAYTHGVWDDVALMQTMLLAPDVAEQHFALATEQALASVEKYLALGIEQIGVGGDFSGTMPLISPEAYRRFIVPEVRTVARRIHEGNATAVNASDGNLWPVIDDFLLGCEVDGYLEIDLHAGMDLKKLKHGYGDRITFYGNLDCGNTLSFASPDEVRQHVLTCLEAGMGNGGHILTASNAITASVPTENYLAMVNAYRELFSLPRLEPPT